MAIRIVYLSTPDFGIPTLRLLAEDRRFDLVGVITQPDKPAGRGLRPTPPPVRIAADELGLHVLQPASLRVPDVVSAVENWRPDLIAVAAYGLWIPETIYDLPPKRSLNLHPSLLPRHRGAAPVMSAIIAGDDDVGLSVLFVEDEMDAGDVFGQLRVPLGPDDTTASVMANLAKLGAPFFLDILSDWAEGKIVPTPQDHTQSTWFDRITKDAGIIDWNMSAVDIDRRWRGLTPWPGAYTFFDGRRLLIRQAKPLVLTEDALPLDDMLALSAADPGVVVAIDQGVAVPTGDGALRLDVLQLEGRQALSVNDFVRGQRTFVGSKLG